MKRVLAIVLASFAISAHADDCLVQLETAEFAFNLNAISAMEAGPLESGKGHGLILKFDKTGKILLEFPTKEDLTAGLTLMGKIAVENECKIYVQRFLQKKEKPVKQEIRRQATKVQV